VANALTHSLGTALSGPQNLSTTERALYMAAGLGLAAAGAKPRPNPLLNILALAGGAYIAWSGYVGHCPVKAMIAGEDDARERIAGRH
jgi:threonine/homoserine/homoserine lactone efflux protein